jgi:hypothetical protein
MKLEQSNPNYIATVVKVHNLIELDNCHNVVAFPIFGYQAIVSKETQVGQMGLLFTAETQLSDDFCKNNNLYRDSTLNIDKDKKGYLEVNRRVKAIKFRGHTSSALFMPLQSLSYLKIKSNDLKEGDSFTSINGVEVCRKYIIKENSQSNRKNKVKGKDKIFNRVDAKLLPEHLDTENYFRNAHKFKDDDYIVVTAKLHGTSVRLSNIPVKRKLTFIEKILKFFKVKINETEYDYIAGSRRVIKDPKTEKEYNHFYEYDIWTECLEKNKQVIPKNYIIYGEIIGWAKESPVMKNYTYKIPQGENELYVYRVVIVNPDGLTTDLTWEQIKEFCKNTGLKCVPEIFVGYHKDFNVEPYMDVKFVKDLGLNHCLDLDDTAPCDEGLCIRIEGLQPYITKAKSPEFLAHETKQLDKGEVDIETSESV